VTARPHLKPFIDLVMINAHVIENCHQNAGISSREMPLTEVQKLEATIGSVHMERQAASSDNRPYDSNIDICEPIAKIHMLWYLILLRSKFWMNSQTNLTISVAVYDSAGQVFRIQRHGSHLSVPRCMLQQVYYPLTPSSTY